MTKIRYNGNHKDFIKELFSVDFIKSSALTSVSFIEQLLNQIAVEKKNKQFVYPTNLFNRLNYACGDSNPDLDYEIFQYLTRLNISSQTILSLLITDVLTSDEQSLNYYLIAFSQQDEEVQGVMIEELFSNQFDSLPDYLLKKLNSMIYNFASEFDLSDGRTDIETYIDKLEYYKNLYS